MTEAAPKIRLFVAAALAPGAEVALTRPQAHYLRNVMRAGPGQEVALFNARDGEWRARIDRLGKGAAVLTVAASLRPGRAEPGPWLVFAAVKRGPLELIVEKATELGVARLQPVATRRTVVGRVNLERLAAIATEAAEQCGRLSVPELGAPLALEALLEEWPQGRTLIHCDEAGGAPPLAAVAAGLRAADCALLVGPEGGFDAAERALLQRRPWVRPVTLGPRILRAETAALAALAVLQALAGAPPASG